MEVYMKKFFAVVVTGFLLMTTACSSSSTNEYENKNTNTSTQFPITIKHAFGETTITEKPERIATIAWGNQDVPLALGVAPVGVSKGLCLRRQLPDRGWGRRGVRFVHM